MSETTCTVIVVSDRAAAGERADRTGSLLRRALEGLGYVLSEVVIVPDERDRIASAIVEAAAKRPLVLTTGGTGITPRDVTPEATRDVLEVEIPGLAEEMRRRSVKTTLQALGSRAVAGALGRSLIVNLPGRPEGALECFRIIAAALPHLLALRQGPVSDASHEPRGPSPHE